MSERQVLESCYGSVYPRSISGWNKAAQNIEVVLYDREVEVNLSNGTSRILVFADNIFLYAGKNRGEIEGIWIGRPYSTFPHQPIYQDTAGGLLHSQAIVTSKIVKESQRSILFDMKSEKIGWWYGTRYWWVEV